MSMKLNDLDKNSAVWLKLEQYLTARLQMLRERNDKNKNEVETAILRGSIKEVKNFISLGKPVMLPESDDPA